MTGGETEFKYYLYIWIRFARYLLITLFIAVFTSYEIISALILIFVNLVEIVYLTQLKIWNRSTLGMILKVFENILFIFVEIALLFVYGFSNTIDDADFINLGSALNVLYVIMIINGIIRVIHHFYLKTKNFREISKYGKEVGRKFTVKSTPLPQMDTPRIDS